MSLDEEDSITLSMDEYARLQNDLLTVKHENNRLKDLNEKYDEVCKQLHAAQEELVKAKQSFEDPLKKIPKFSRDSIINCLKSVRKQEEFDKDQTLLIEQLMAITEYLWPKGGESEVKVVDHQEIVANSEIKLMKDANQKLKVNLEAIEEKCRAMSISLEETAKENLAMYQKIADLESKKEHLILDLASREEELIEARKQLKDKFALECTKQSLELELSALKSLNETTQKALESSKTDPEILSRAESLQQELNELKNNENLLTIEYTNLKTSTKQTMCELAASKTTIKESEATIKRLEEAIKKSQLELEDMKTERQIIQKRSLHDLKDLKSELIKEKNLHEQCKMDKEKVMTENRKLQESMRAGVKLAPPSHQEKVLVESMSHRVEELERENHALRGKIKELTELVAEAQKIKAANEELLNENNRLTLDFAMMGAQFNELMRTANQKSPINLANH